MSITGSEQWMYSSGREFYDFPIEQSLRFNRADSTYLNRTASSPTLGTKATWSFWIKKCDVVSDTSSSYRTVFYCGTPNVDGFRIGFARYSGNNHVLHISQDNGPSAAYIFMRTEAALRDTSAWYNFVIRYDSTDATAADRIKVYINGELASIQSSPRTNPPLNHIPKWQVSGTTLKIGKGRDDSNEHYDMYLADVHFIDGQALDPTSFGEFKSGIWIPKDTSGLTFGTNGFRLQFGDTTEASGFNTLTYSGDNINPKSVNGCGFSPDFVWVKQRTNNGGGATFHQLYDSVRGTQKLLRSNTTDAELANPSNGGVQSFDADGFTIQGSSASLNMNGSGETYVAWCWDAGSGSAASNTDGSITSTVKANTDYGFSIATFIGTGANATIGHGLGQTPDAVIVKQRSAAGNHWVVWTNALSGTQFLYLDATNTPNTNANIWNSTTPTSSVFSVGSDAQTNGSGNNLVAYCFAEKTGYSKIGTYSGTGAVGNSITTGFKPAFIMIKRTDAAFGWYMYDTTRQVQNPMGSQTDPLLANSSNAEGGADPSWYIDVTDTGFTINNTSLFDNASGGTYIYMAFADTRNAAFWKDTSGQGNDWQPNNLVFSDVVPDSTTNNFAVVPSTTLKSTGYSQHTEGNLQLYQPSWGGWDINLANFNLPSSGKYYWEVMPVQGIFNAGYGAFVFGIGNIRGRENISGFPTFGNPLIQVDSRGIGEYRQYPSWVDYTKSGSFGFTVGSTVYGIAVDCDAKKFWFSLDNSWAGTSGTTLTAGTGDPANGTNGDPISGDITDYVPFFNLGDQQSSCKLGINFGQDSTFAGARAAGGNADENGYGDFAYAPPSGFLSLCSANMPSGAINTLADETPEDYFNTVLYSGNSTNNTPITVGFQPSMTWIKTRNVVRDHRLMDAVRGATAGIYPNLTNAEGASPLISFDADGFTLNNTNNYNNTGETYVGWNWKAGGSGVSNTDGSITSTVSVGATSQQNWFSVATYTGTGANATVGHGLGVAPDMVIITGRNITYGGGIGGDWIVWHNSFSATERIYLNYTNAKESSAATWNSTFPSSSVVSLGNNLHVNYNSTSTYVMYSFANAEGLCKVGSYVGNGSADGVFVHTGHRPSFLLIKETGNANSWELFDTARDPDNVASQRLFPNTSAAEATTNPSLDILSNGFKARAGNTGINRSGGSYIFLSISEQPFKYANAR